MYLDPKLFPRLHPSVAPLEDIDTGFARTMNTSTGPWDDAIRHGDQAWQLTAAALVCLQSVPGILLLYAGLSKAKWVINSMYMGFYAFAAVLVVWVLFGYNMAFGEEWIPLCGVPKPVLGMGTMLSRSIIPAEGIRQDFPLATMVYYQFGFAAMTLVIIAGAVVGRMNLLAWIIFTPLWLILSYCPVCFSHWGGGFLARLGVIDYTGGFIVHVSSGAAGFVAAAWVGPRHVNDLIDHRPSNLGFVLTGASIIWVGWTGFNGGGPFMANASASAAVLNTNICAAVAILVWSSLDTIYYRKPTLIGSVQGMITGLVVITPGAGVVPGWAAVVMGVLGGSIPWATMNILGRKAPLCYVDDTLGGIHTHLVAGALGGVLTGIFASDQGTQAFGLRQGGAIAGNPRLIGIQMVAAVFVIGWNVAWTSLILLGIRHVLRIPLRFPEAILLVGDDAISGEAAYSLAGGPLLAFPADYRFNDADAPAATTGHKSDESTQQASGFGVGSVLSATTSAAGEFEHSPHVTYSRRTSDVRSSIVPAELGSTSAPTSV